MNWFTATITSSIGKKFIMSLAGIFLLLFLPVHLGINMLLILCESTDWFNIAAHFMATNPVIKVFEVFLMLAVILHIIYGAVLQIQNWKARPVRYKVENLSSQTSFFSKWMIHTAVIIGIVLFLHLKEFYFGSKFLGEATETVINGKSMHDMAAMVLSEFSEFSEVLMYTIWFVILGIHLNHAFQSAFQTLGFNHNKYTAWVKFIGIAYSILIPLGFITVAMVIYMRS